MSPPGWVMATSRAMLNQLFLSLMPFRLTHQKYVDLLRGSADRARIENFMRVEQWIFDSPDQAGTAFREFVVWFYQENRLVRNRLEIAGRKVDLHALRLPMLNLIGKRDHLVPPEASAACNGWSEATTTRRSNSISDTSACTSARARNARCRRRLPAGSRRAEAFDPTYTRRR
jgi:poly(3-hydroxyalkanoate) synthetase